MSANVPGMMTGPVSRRQTFAITGTCSLCLLQDAVVSRHMRDMHLRERIHEAFRTWEAREMIERK